MKYCKKCGMLLENNMTSCIGCGNDVTKKTSYTNYPVAMQERLDEEKKIRTRSNITSAVKIAVILILLLVLMGVFIAYLASSSKNTQSDDKSSLTTKLLNSFNMEEKSEEELAMEKENRLKNRSIADDEGYYYKNETIKDENGKELFTTVYPEDLNVVNFSVDNSKYSKINPAVFSFVAQNEENTARFTYMSTQHFVYFEKGIKAGRSNEADVDSYISLLKYNGAKEYIEMLINQFYKGAKRIEFEDETDAMEEVNKLNSEGIENIADYSTDFLVTLLGMSEGTKITRKNVETCNKIYRYRIINSNSEAVTALFYVPVAACTYEYVDKANSDSGELTNWFVLSIVGFEAGSDDIFDEYREGYDLFLNNSLLLDDFYSIEESYADAIITTKSDGLKKYYNYFKNTVNTPPTATKKYTEDGYSIFSEDEIMQIFIDPARNMVFATHSDSEYPGEPYFDLFVQ